MVRHIASRICPIWVLLAGASTWAGGLDRDGLLTEAPATPSVGTIRVTGGAGGAGNGTSNESLTTATASLMWVPLQNVAGDVGVYYQDATVGPTARLRVQFLSQVQDGIDFAAGARFKVVGFYSPRTDAVPPHEMELLVAIGKKLGRADLIFNAVVGSEINGPGKDAELKALVAHRISDFLRLGLEGRLQAEFVDEHGTKLPRMDDMAFVLGPVAAWFVTHQIQIQALAGAMKAKGPGTMVGPGAMLLAAIDI